MGSIKLMSVTKVEVEKVKDKMRRIVPFFLVALVMMASLFGQANVTYAKTLDLDAQSAILVDADTGKVLFAKNPDEVLPPASMTKMMTEYLVWEAVESGQISWDTTTEISDYAYELSKNNAFSGVGLRQNKEYTVRDLYEAMAINSDNATTVALAELIAGSEGEFVKMMNEKAAEMGLTDYEFVNASGLDNESLGDNYPEGTEPDATNLLSARSTALLAFHLVNDYPEALEISSIPETEFDEQQIRNWNWMLKHDASFLEQFYYEGVDGLKTGYTELAGNNFTGTAIRDNQRLITVVMNTDSRESRFEETAKLLDYGFNNFKKEELFKEGFQLQDMSTLPVAKGKEDKVEIATEQAISTILKNGEDEKYSIEYTIDKDKLNKDGELVAPIVKGEVIGTAELVYDGEEEGYIFSDESKSQKVNLITTNEVEKKNWFMLTIGAIGDFFANLFSSIVDTIKGWF